MSSSEELAICVRGADKSYGRGSKRTRVLADFNMSVPKGNIYGLLGKQNSELLPNWFDPPSVKMCKKYVYICTMH